MKADILTRGGISPFGRLVVFSGLAAVEMSVRSLSGELFSDALDAFYRICWGLLLVWWVESDARRTRYWPCFEYDLFLFTAWVFVLPQFLFHTRGRRGLWTFLGILGLALFPRVASLLVYLAAHGVVLPLNGAP